MEHFSGNLYDTIAMGLPEPKAREGPMVLSEAKDTRCEQSEQRTRMAKPSGHDPAKQEHGTIAMGLPRMGLKRQGGLECITQA